MCITCMMKSCLTTILLLLSTANTSYAWMQLAPALSPPKASASLFTLPMAGIADDCEMSDDELRNVQEALDAASLLESQASERAQIFQASGQSGTDGERHMMMDRTLEELVASSRVNEEQFADLKVSLERFLKEENQANEATLASSSP